MSTPAPPSREPSPSATPRHGRSRVAVLGAGFSGLCVAHRLQRAGLEVRLFEADRRWGGLAQTFERDGFRYDFGPHYITNRLATNLGLLDRCVHVPYAESLYLGGRWYAFPFGLVRNPLYAAGAALGMLRSSQARAKCRNAADFFRVCYGGALADQVLCPLVAKWSGVAARDLSVDFVDRVPPPSVGVLARKLLGVVTRRSIQTMPNQGIVYHVIPRDGIQAVSDVLARDLGERIRLGAPVKRVRVERGAVACVEAGDESYACDAVVSTLPAPVLPRLIEGAPDLEPLTQLRFRPVVLGFLEVDRPRVLDRLLTWFPEPEWLFYRLSEQKIADPASAPAGRTLLTVEIACNEDDFAWTATQDQLRERLVEQIAGIFKLPREVFGGFESRRTRFGYPMYDLHTDHARRTLEVEACGGGIEGMFLVGRSGSFRYILLEEAHTRAGAMAEKILTWAAG